MKTEVISSAWTPFAKFLFGPAALCFISWQCWMIVRIYLENPHAFSTGYFLVVVPASLAGAVYLIVTRALLLSRVSLGERELFVSNFFNESVIPFTDVESVKGRAFPGPEIILISFRRSTEVGNRIVFMPKGRRLDIWKRHPLVSRLEDYASGSVNWMADPDDDFCKRREQSDGPFQVRPEDRGRILPPSPKG